MSSTFIFQFASTSLRLFRHSGQFDISVPAEIDLEEVALEYESYGHFVERDEKLHQLSVSCGAVADIVRMSKPLDA